MLHTNFLDEKLFHPGGCYVGYSSYTTKRITSTHSGLWVGYRRGVPYFTLRFRNSYPKQRFSKDIWTHFTALNTLFSAIHREVTPMVPPLVLISSKKAVRFIADGQFKFTGLGEKDKAEMFFWLKTLAPQIQHYDPLLPPFSILRELMLLENKHVTELIAGKKFFDYSELAVVPS